MATCPKCKAKIDFLIARVTEVIICNYHDGIIQDTREQIQSEIDYFKCPECYAQLDIADQAAADEFLASGIKK